MAISLADYPPGAAALDGVAHFFGRNYRKTVYTPVALSEITDKSVISQTFAFFKNVLKLTVFLDDAVLFCEVKVFRQRRKLTVYRNAARFFRSGAFISVIFHKKQKTRRGLAEPPFFRNKVSALPMNRKKWELLLRVLEI